MLVDAAFECEGEGVECWFPADDPSGFSFPRRIEGAQCKVDTFESGLLVGKMASRSDGTSNSGVQTLDRVGGIYDAADLRAEAEERHELCPSGFPHPYDRRILHAPLGRELGEPFFCCCFGRCRVDGP